MRSDELFWFWFSIFGMVCTAVGLFLLASISNFSYRHRKSIKRIGILLTLIGAVLFGTGLGYAFHVRNNWEKPFYTLINSKAVLVPHSEWRSIRDIRADSSHTIRSTSFLGIEGVDTKYLLSLIPPADELYIRRKLIVVERDKKGRIDVDLIPSDLQPLTSEQVGTIAYVDQQRFSDASYTHGGQFYSREFRLTFVDVDTNTVIGVVQFCSPKEAPGAMTEGADKTIEPEKGDIVKYIQSLKRIE
jgi:hypothetical protein